MLFGVLFNINSWDLVKHVSINAFWIFWYLPKLVPWPILILLLVIVSLGISSKYVEWKRAAAAVRRQHLAENEKMDLLRKIEENTRPKV